MLILPWKLLFIFIMIFGSLFAISASSWFMAWIGLEINMLALLALFMSGPSSRNSEATLKYFLVQALASAILISSALSTSNLFSFLSSAWIFSSFILMSLLLKMGAAPFHLWIPQVMEGLSWINNAIILSWQKVAPFFLLSAYSESKFSHLIFLTSIILSSTLGAIMGLSHSSVRKIMAFSSINHLGWMLLAITISFKLWMCYFISYCVILLSIIFLLNSLNLSNISNTRIFSSWAQFSLFISLLSFGGLPPLFGFFPKWVIIQSISNSSLILLIVLVFSSLIALFFYARIMFNSLLKKTYFSKPTLSQPLYLAVPMMINLSGIIMFPILFIL